MSGQEDLERRVSALEERVSRLESDGDEDVDSDEGVAPSVAPPEQSSEQESHDDEDKRDFSSASVLAWIGSVILGLGCVFFIAYAINQGWITKPLQVLIGVVAGVGVMIGGHWLHGRRALQGSLLSGVGAVITYFSVFAAYAFPSYQAATGLPFTASMVLLGLTALAPILFSLWHDTSALLFEGLILTFLTQFAGDFAQWASWISVVYTAALTAGGVVLCRVRDWERSMWGLGVVSATFTAVTAGRAAAAGHEVLSIGFIAAYGVIFLAASLAEDNDIAGSLIVASSYGMSFFPLTVAESPDYAAVTVSFAALSLVLYAYTALNEREGWPYLAAGVALLAAYVPLSFDAVVVKPVWALLFGLVGYADSRRDNPWLTGLTAALGVATAAVFLLAFRLEDASTPGHVLGSLFAVASSLAVSLAYASRSRFEAHPYYVASVAAAFVLAYQHLSETWLTVAWGAVGFLSLAAGSQTDRQVPRVTGLVALAVAVVKLFVVDTLSLDPVLRIVSYVVLGVLLLGASLFYNARQN